MSCNTKILANIPIIIANNSIMKLNYFNKTLIDIPLNIYSYSQSKLIFQLNQNIGFEDTKLLWNVNDINNIKINITNNKNYKLVDDYIYNYNLQNYNYNNIYQLSKNKILVSPISKTLNSSWFLSNLYK
jgi:hypothetical protein